LYEYAGEGAGTYEERKRQMIDFADIACLSSCAYCKGWFETSERFAPAEQMPL
jgi:hypothetical protein